MRREAIKSILYDSPGRSAKGVNVNAGPRSGRSYNHPPVGRPLGLTAVLEQVVSEVFGEMIILQKLLPPGMVSVAAVKDIERAVILSGSADVEERFKLYESCMSLTYFI